VKFRTRFAYQVCVDTGDSRFWRRAIGHKARLLSQRRANHVARWLERRGIECSIRLFGRVTVTAETRLFD
jgi:transposase InsO family protein